MSGQYEVLSPWAEVDPIPLRGISPRVTDLTAKRIGLFCNSKPAARPVMTVVEEELKKRLPNTKISWYVPREVNRYNIVQIESPANKEVFEEWVEGMDAVIAAIGD
jgi:hypothetical protein